MAAPAAVLNILVTASTAQANAALARTQGQLTSTAATAQKSSGKFATAAKTWGKNFAMAAAVAGAGAIKLGMDFEDAMVQISTQAGASAKEVERMKQPILDLARASEFGPEELAKGLFRVESAGYRGARAMEILKAATDLADVGHADLEETTRAYVAAISSGIKGTQDYNKAAGLMNAIVGQGSMRMNDLVSAFGTGLLPRAKAVGVGLDEVGAALGVLTQQGMGASSSATRLGMTLSFMVRKPTAEAEEALNRLNIGQGKMAEMLQKPDGLLRVLTLLHDRLKKIPESQRAALVGQIFGGGRSSAAIMTLLGNLDQYTGKLQGVRKESSEFSKAIEEDNKTLASKVAMAWAFIRSILTQAGMWINAGLNAMIAAIPGVIQAFRDMGKWIGNVGQWISRAVSNFTGFIGALLPVKVAIFELKVAFALLSPPIKIMLGILKAVGGVLMSIVVANFRVAWQVIKTFGNVVGNVVGIVSNLLRGDFAGAWRNAKELVGGVVGGMKKVVTTAFDAMKDVVFSFKGAFNAIKGPIVGVIHGITNALKGIIEAVATVIKKFDNMSDALPDVPKIGGFDPNKGLLENIFGQKGIIVPGRGSGDKVPAMLEPGEVVLNRKAVAAMGGAQRANAINRAIPRFAGGGVIARGLGAVGASGVGMAGVAALDVIARIAAAAGGGAAGNWKSIDKLAAKFNLARGTLTGRLGQPGSWHGVMGPGGRARATDYSGGASGMMKFFQGLVPLARRGKLRELFYDPGGGWDNGTSIGAIGGHMDHVHVALQRGGIVGDFAKAAVATKSPKKAAYALFMAGLAESGMRDLSYGDSTSQGVLQILTDTARRMGLNVHDEFSIAKAFLLRGFWGKGGGIDLAKSGKSAPTIAHLVQGNRTGTGVYAAQAGAAQDLLKDSGLKFMPGDVARMGPLRKTDPKTVPKPKYDPEAWAAALPADIQANIERLAGETGVINRYADYASRAAALDEKVAGKDELGWLRMQLQAQQELRDTYIAAKGWIEWMVLQYSKWIQEAKERIGYLRYVIQLARNIQKGIGDRFPNFYANMFNLPHGKLTEQQKKKIPKWIEQWRGKIQEHRDKIGMWTDKRTKTEALMSGEGGIRDSMRALQGFITDPTLEWASVNLGAPGMAAVFGGEIGSVLQAIQEGSKVEPTEPTENPLLQQQLQLQQQMLDQLAQQLYVSQAQYAVLQQTPGPPYVGSFAQGGVVPQTGMAMVHKGEVIGSPQPIVILVKDGAVRPDYIQAISGREAERLLRRSGRGGRVPGRAGSMT